MKLLAEYMEGPSEQLRIQHGAFYAVNQQQFDEQAKDGVNYVNMGNQLHCPELNAGSYMMEQLDIYEAAIEQQCKEFTAEEIILAELDNREWNLTAVIEIFQDYPFGEEEIRAVWNRSQKGRR